MPFTFKLSQRLARMRECLAAALVVVITLGAVYACEMTRSLSSPPKGAPSVASVTINPDSASSVEGQSLQLLAILKDSAGNQLSGRSITWATSATTVATVSSSGVVTAVAAGTATITATSEGHNGKAGMRVTQAPVASVTVSPSIASVVVGQTVQFTPTLKDANGRILTGRLVTWASSNAAVVTVSANGLASGVTAGSATITATSEGISGTAALTVTAAPPPPPGNPGTVSDLAVATVTDTSATLSFTEVNDGTGLPASYDVRFAAGTITWATATDVARGSCAVPVAGTAIGAKRSCTVLGLGASTAYQFQVVAFRGTLNVNAVFGGLSNVASGTTAVNTAPVASVTVSPASASVVLGTVQQFSATLKDASGNTLTGRTVTWATSNALVATVSGTGLATSVALGTVTVTATSGGVNGTASLTVTAAPPGGVLFQSDWSAGTGTAFNIVTDGGRWKNYWEFNNNQPVQLLSVVAGGPPGYANALQVLQRGPNFAANVQQDSVMPLATDFYVRYYMMTKDTSPAGDHVVTVDTWGYANLTYLRKWATATGWQFVNSFYGCGYTYPIGHWGPALTLSRGVWYRFEYFVHFVDATHIQVHPRVYDAAGTQILSEADYQQSDPGSAVWNGRSDWTLASYYAAGYSFCVDPTMVRNFGMGNNGQQGSVDTGLAWYFAGVQIRSDHWAGQ